jgi:hypothetical protein
VAAVEHEEQRTGVPLADHRRDVAQRVPDVRVRRVEAQEHLAFRRHRDEGRRVEQDGLRAFGARVEEPIDLLGDVHGRVDVDHLDRDVVLGEALSHEVAVERPRRRAEVGQRGRCDDQAIPHGRADSIRGGLRFRCANVVARVADPSSARPLRVRRRLVPAVVGQVGA